MEYMAIIKAILGGISTVMEMGNTEAGDNPLNPQKALQRTMVELEKSRASEMLAAGEVMQRGGEEAGRARREASAEIGTQRVAFAANNMVGTSGTAAKLSEASAFSGEDAASAAKANAIAEALGHKQTADARVFAGQEAVRDWKSHSMDFFTNALNLGS